MHQIYSTGENVLEVNLDGAKPQIIGELFRNRKAWVAQEMNKGTATQVIVRLLGGMLSGEAGNWARGARGGWDRSGAPLPTTPEQKIVNPYFEKFSEAALHQLDPAGAAPAADFAIRSRLLGEEIPALSWPAGSQPVAHFAKTDLVTLWANLDSLESTRRMMPSGLREWYHSDIKDISYLHTYPFFNQVVRHGNLNR